MLRRCALVLLLPLFLVAPAAATTISVQATDLADTGAGDLWRYDFTVGGATFNTDVGFSIFFDPVLYGSLQSPPVQPSPDWDVLVLQPDAQLPADGVYDALALVDAASLAVTFATEFIWLGATGTAPGTSLPFTVQQFAPDGSLITVLESGGATVPEPALPGLLMLMLLAWRTRRV